VNGIWQMVIKFRKKCTSLSLKFGVLFVGGIDQQIFRALATFCLAKKVC